MSRTVVLLPNGVGSDAIDDAARAMGLRIVNVVPKSDGVPPQVLFARVDGEGHVAFVDDDRLGRVYAVTEGTLAESIAADLARHLGFEPATGRLGLGLSTIGVVFTGESIS